MRACSWPRLVARFGAAAALAACSVDGATFAQGGGGEDCSAEGDEDGNGVADCADPACAGATACRVMCGNGRLEAGEACDDGNAVGGDGCESTCVVTGTGRYEASADAMVRISSATADASTAFGAQPPLATYGSSFGTRARSLLAFDLAALPAGAAIRSARLHVRLIDQAGADFSIEVHEVTAPWSEATVTWNNQPAFGAAAEATLAFQSQPVWRFDVTALVQRWAGAPSTNLGLALVQSPESVASGGRFARFDSREGTNRPFLEIVVGN